MSRRHRWLLSWAGMVAATEILYMLAHHFLPHWGTGLGFIYITFVVSTVYWRAEERDRWNLIKDQLVEYHKLRDRLSKHQARKWN